MRGLPLSASCILPLGIALAAGLPAASAEEGLRLGDRAPIYQADPDSTLDLTDEVTLEAWVRADRMSEAGGRILDKSTPGTQDGYMLDTQPGNSLRLLNAHGMCRHAAKLAAIRATAGTTRNGMSSPRSSSGAEAATAQKPRKPMV